MKYNVQTIFYQHQNTQYTLILFSR